MALYRTIQTSFWTDPIVSDDYTPNDKLFYIYLMTNPHTNLCGCYEISVKQMAYEIGFTAKEIETLINKAENTFKTIMYSKETKELLILKWSKYNWTASDKFRASISKEIQMIKNPQFKDYLNSILRADTVSDFFDTLSSEKGYPIDTLSEKEGYPIQLDYTSSNANANANSNASTSTNADSDTEVVTEDDIIENVVSYLNAKCGTNYKASTENTKKHIRARLKDGYTEEDFYTVIDKKAEEWIGTEQEKYLRPETLFGAKFEGYLNQNIRSPAKKTVYDEWAEALNNA